MHELKDLSKVDPEYHSHYAEIERDGEKLYQLKVVGAQNEIAQKYKTKAEELDRLKSELSAKAEKAEAERLEALREKGDFKALLDDATAKLTAAQERAQARDKLVSSKAKQSLISGMGDVFIDEGRATASRLLDSMVNFDPEAEKYTFFDESGGALALDEKGFREYIKKSALFAPLVAAEVSTGGHGRNANANAPTATKSNMGGSREERKAAIAKKFNL